MSKGKYQKMGYIYFPNWGSYFVCRSEAMKLLQYCFPKLKL